MHLDLTCLLMLKTLEDVSPIANDGFPLSYGLPDVRDNVVFAILDHLHMTRIDDRRWGNCRNRLCSQRLFPNGCKRTLQSQLHRRRNRGESISPTWRRKSFEKISLLMLQLPPIPLLQEVVHRKRGLDTCKNKNKTRTSKTLSISSCRVWRPCLVRTSRRPQYKRPPQVPCKVSRYLPVHSK